jgi:hypothetical protein
MWTIFAYPARLADENGLPKDAEARRYLAALQSRGLPVSVWRYPQIPDTVYFACPFEDHLRVYAATQELERQGEFPAGFASRKCEELFARMTLDR